MRYYISYFYNLRYLPKELIPISTAISDPSWYRAKEGEPWLDKRGVLCGMNFPELSHPKKYGCGCPCTLKDPRGCDFLRTYREHLWSLDFPGLISKFESLAEYLRGSGLKVDGYCLMVYETPENPCSERKPLQELWEKNGLELLEFFKPSNPYK